MSRKAWMNGFQLQSQPKPGKEPLWRHGTRTRASLAREEEHVSDFCQRLHDGFSMCMTDQPDSDDLPEELVGFEYPDVARDGEELADLDRPGRRKKRQVVYV